MRGAHAQEERLLERVGVGEPAAEVRVARPRVLAEPQQPALAVREELGVVGLRHGVRRDQHDLARLMVALRLHRLHQLGEHGHQQGGGRHVQHPRHGVPGVRAAQFPRRARLQCAGK